MELLFCVAHVGKSVNKCQYDDHIEFDILVENSVRMSSDGAQMVLGDLMCVLKH